MPAHGARRERCGTSGKNGEATLASCAKKMRQTFCHLHTGITDSLLRAARSLLCHIRQSENSERHGKTVHEMVSLNSTIICDTL